MPVGLWNQPHGGGRLVHMLATRAAGPVDLHFNVLRPNFHVYLFHLRQHGHGGGGGLDAAIGLRHRHPLDPVDAALEFQPGPGAPAIDEKIRLFDATQLRVVVVEKLHGPAPGRRRTWSTCGRGCGQRGRSPRRQRRPGSPQSHFFSSLGSLGSSRIFNFSSNLASVSLAD